MKNTEERVLAVKLRAKEIETQKRIHRRHMLSISSLAASLILIVGLSFFMPGLMTSMSDCGYSNFGASASIFDESNILGYILTGFLAFALGISVTILSYKIKLKNQLDKEARDD